MNVNLRQLQAFCTVARLGSFTKAAAALHATQPALSVQIGQLEEALGLRLFDRTTRSVAITPVGKALLVRAERTLAELAGIVDSARELGSRNVGRVAVAALPSMASGLMPQAIAGFAAAFPGIDVKLADALGGKIAELVRDGDVDFGVTAQSPADAGMQFTPLGSDEMVAVAPRGHALSRKPRVTLEALVEHPLILMSRDSSVRRLIDAAFAAKGRFASPVQEPVYMSTAIAMVRAGLGVAVLPSSASELRANRDLDSRPIAHRALKRRLGILTKRGQTPSPATAEFERFLKATANSWF